MRHKTKYKDLNETERQLRSLELRRAGASYEKIGTELGSCKATAYRDVKRHLDGVREQCRETAQEIIDIDLERMDEALEAIHTKIMAGECKAIETMLKIMERRAKLLGLDAAVKQELSITESATPEAAARHVRELFGDHAVKRTDEPVPSGAT